MKELLRNPDSFYKILELTVSTLDIGEMMTRVVDECTELFGCDKCALYLVDKKGHELYTLVLLDPTNGKVRLPLDKSASLAGFVAETGTEIMIENVHDQEEPRSFDNDLAFSPALDKKCAIRTQQVISVPLKMKGEIIGVMQGLNKPGGFLNKDLVGHEGIFDDPCARSQ